MTEFSANNSATAQWWEVTVTCPLALEDTVYWEFEQLGSKGTASQQKGDTCAIAAYLLKEKFQPEDFELLQQLLVRKAAARELPSVPQVSWRLIDEEDWSKSWKAHWKAEEIGDRLLINPAWMPPPATERTILTLDPGSAFGTGAHATTQLCLKALEQQSLSGITLADVGCGSGILSIAALLYGAGRAYAADVDPLAIKATRANAALNNIAENRLQVQLGSIGEVAAMARQNRGKPVDGIVCNILSEIIVELIIPDLNQLAGQRTWGIFSGILTAKAPWVEEHLNSQGWQVTDTTHQDEWCAMTARLS